MYGAGIWPIEAHRGQGGDQQALPFPPCLFRTYVVPLLNNVKKLIKWSLSIPAAGGGGNCGSSSTCDRFDFLHVRLQGGTPPI